ncbi:MAG: IS1634 family transposase [Flexistipes sinusarabici]|uniref:IS1634 family transposase n=1 Tax=Flexistipes sinusarabici TaxID=2352 RepID=A0A5D0MPT9_FLESI|nr:IS1634 family transposase [Flexistipes sinusarabici]TYB33348.1 MAG: IS1634 family transposase [Flexistipes sinusarabici]
MFIRAYTTTNKKTGKKYTTHKLVESYRTINGPRQRIVMDMGNLSHIPAMQLKELANRIEQLLDGYEESVFKPDKETEELARAYAKKAKLNIIASSSKQPETELSKPEYEQVDVSSVEVSEPRSIGGEYICNESFKELGIGGILRSLGFTESEIEISRALIIGRMLNPGSELCTYEWLKERSGLFELLGINYHRKSLRQFYRVSEKLFKYSEEIEKKLFEYEQQLFNFGNKILLYDLTNTHFEGIQKNNKKAKCGKSKQKRSDCPLVTLGVVLNEEGFPICSKIYEDNQSEVKTLVDIVTDLSSKVNLQIKPTVVIDAGIASEENLKFIKDSGYNYIAVSRKKDTDLVYSDGEDTSIKNDPYGVRGKLNIVGEESFLCVSSEMREFKEGGIKDIRQRFEEGLENIRSSLFNKNGVKNYEKVYERIGRLKSKCRKVSRYYDIEVVKKEDSDNAADVRWKVDEEKLAGTLDGNYVIRTNLTDLSEQEIWDIYVMLNDVESTFRALKSELGLRPVYHSKESAVDGHLFISVLAYHLVHNLRRKLKSAGIHYSWRTIREKLSNHIRMTVSMNTKENGRIMLRVTSKAEEHQKSIYSALGYSYKILRNKKVCSK